MTTTTKINLSRLMKCAWYLVKEKCYSMSYAMITVWAEMKETIKSRIAQMVISENVQYTGSTWTPSPETMAAYYNSNCYKAD